MQVRLPKLLLEHENFFKFGENYAIMNLAIKLLNVNIEKHGKLNFFNFDFAFCK